MSVLILHPEDISTNFLKPLYAPIQDKTVITGGVNKMQLRQLIKEHDRVIMLGHGSPWGLLNVGRFPDVGSYVIDYSFCDLLSAQKENIFIWCHANLFVKQHGLAGFNSGMFISEVGEAFCLEFYVADGNLIKESNEGFASIVSRNIHRPLHNLYKNVLQEYSALARSNPIARFNSERLYLNSNH